MPLFNYKARDKNGKIVKSVIDAESIEGAVQELITRGLLVIKVKPQNILTKDISSIRFFEARISKKQLARLFSQLAALSAAEITVNEALRLLKIQTAAKQGVHGFSPQVSELLESLHAEVQSGRSLSDCMMSKKEIPEAVAGLIRIGELSGNMTVVFKNISLQYDKESRAEQVIRSAAVYPLFVLILMVVVMVVGMSMVIPQFIEMFDLLGGELPLITKILIDTSVFLRRWWLWIVFCVSASVLLIFYTMLKTSGIARSGMDRLLLGLPIIGTFNRLRYNSLLARTLHVLLMSNMTGAQALERCKLVAGNRIFLAALENAHAQVINGRRISEALSDSRYISAVFINMIAVGEETGDLAKIVGDAANYLENDFMDYTAGITKAAEPTLTIIIGIMVAIVMAALILPTFSMANMI